MLWKIVHYAAINALDKYALCYNSCSGKLCIMLQFRLWTSICTFYCNSCSVQWTSLHYAAVHALENYSLCCHSCSVQVCTMQQFMLLRSSTMQHFRLWISMHYAAINALDNYALCSNSFLLFSHSRVTNTLYGSYSSRKNKLRWLAHRWGRIRWWGYTTAGLRNCFHTLCVGCVVLYPV